MLPFLLLVFSREVFAECPRPKIPQRMIMDIPSGNGTHLFAHFPTGARVNFRCHEAYNDFLAPIETIYCQADGHWWPQYVPNFCANELKRELTLKENPSGKVYTLPLNTCLSKKYTSLEISLGGPYFLNHFAIMSERDVTRVSIRLVVKENGFEIFKEGIIIEGLVGGEEKLIDCDLPEVTHVIVKSSIPLCSFRAAVLDPGQCSMDFVIVLVNPYKCTPFLAGSIEAGRIAEVAPKQVKFSCDFNRDQLSMAFCDEKGLWTSSAECSAPRDIACSKNSIISNNGEYTCNLEHFTPSRSHDCYCDTFSGFVRHPNGSCVVMADCPDGSQRHCADFEELVLFGAMEATCNQNTPSSITSDGFRCQCKPGLVRMLATGKCVPPERCIKNDRRETGLFGGFDVNCDGAKIYYNYDYVNLGFCETGLFRTRRGHCVKKEYCEDSWKDNWFVKLLGIGNGATRFQ